MSGVHRTPFRAYRAQSTTNQDLLTYQIVIAETDLWIASRTDLSVMAAEKVRTLRGQLEAYAVLHPEFFPSLTPLVADDHAPEIVRRMCVAGQATGVGPMAAVAGTIAQMVAEDMQPLSADVLIENGGDTYLCSTQDRYIGLLPVPGQAVRVCVPVAAAEFPCSFCASSATIGHSLSFGNADLVVTRSKDAALADAAATALANRLRSAHDMDSVLDMARQWQAIGLDGVFAQCGEKIGVWGQMELAIR